MKSKGDRYPLETAQGRGDLGSIYQAGLKTGKGEGRYEMVEEEKEGLLLTLTQYYSEDFNFGYHMHDFFFFHMS